MAKIRINVGQEVLAANNRVLSAIFEEGVGHIALLDGNPVETGVAITDKEGRVWLSSKGKTSSGGIQWVELSVNNPGAFHGKGGKFVKWKVLCIGFHPIATHDKPEWARAIFLKNPVESLGWGEQMERVIAHFQETGEIELEEATPKKMETYSFL